MVPLALPSLAAAAEPPEHDTLQATIFSGLGALAAGDLSAGAMMQPMMGGSERSLELTLEACTPALALPGRSSGVLRGSGWPVLPLVTPASASPDPAAGHAQP